MDPPSGWVPAQTNLMTSTAACLMPVSKVASLIIQKVPLANPRLFPGFGGNNHSTAIIDGSRHGPITVQAILPVKERRPTELWFYLFLANRARAANQPQD